MNGEVPLAQITAPLRASVRVAAWLVLAPPFNSRAVPGTVKALLSVAIALPMVPGLALDTLPEGMPDFITSVVMQVIIGAGLGLLTQVMFATVTAVGDLLDIFGGFMLAFAYDPLMQSGSAVMGRVYGWAALALLFASNGHLLVMGGFLRTYELIPLDASIDFGALSTGLVSALGQMMLAALQVAGPLIAVLFLSDVALGLLTRVAPALNPFAIGFPMKILITMLLVGAGVAVLPELVNTISIRTTEMVVGVAAR